MGVAYAAVDRPAWKEVVGIVLACAVVLVLLVRLDRAAYEAQMDRARKAIAAQRAETSTGRASAGGALRRITGPSVAPDVPARHAGDVPARASGAAQPHAGTPATVAPAAPAGSERSPVNLLVALLAGLGTLLTAVGAVLVGLGRR